MSFPKRVIMSGVQWVWFIILTMIGLQSLKALYMPWSSENKSIGGMVDCVCVLYEQRSLMGPPGHQFPELSEPADDHVDC